MSVNEGTADGIPTIEYESVPSTAVALELATVLNREVTQVAPLADSIDPESIDRLFRHSGPGTELRVAFEHEGCRIEITSERIDITPLDGC